LCRVRMIGLCDCGTGMKADQGMCTIPSECRGKSPGTVRHGISLTVPSQSIRHGLHAHLGLCPLRLGRRQYPYMEEQCFGQAGADGYAGEAADGVPEEVAGEVGGRGDGQEDRAVRLRHGFQMFVLMLCDGRQRHVPSAIKKTTDLKRTMLDARKAKEENRRRHTREGESKPKAERKSTYSSPVWSRPFAHPLLPTFRGYGCGAEIDVERIWQHCLDSLRMHCTDLIAIGAHRSDSMGKTTVPQTFVASALIQSRSQQNFQTQTRPTRWP
jgi:hypothetical protein